MVPDEPRTYELLGRVRTVPRRWRLPGYCQKVWIGFREGGPDDPPRAGYVTRRAISLPSRTGQPVSFTRPRNRMRVFNPPGLHRATGA